MISILKLSVHFNTNPLYVFVTICFENYFSCGKQLYKCPCLSVRPSVRHTSGGNISQGFHSNSIKFIQDIHSLCEMINNILLFQGHLSNFNATQAIKTGLIWGFQAFSRERIRGVALISHADVSWSPSELIKILVTVCSFSSFWRHFDFVEHIKFVISGDSLENVWEKLHMLMYPHHFQNWLSFGHGLWFSSFWQHFDLTLIRW